MVWVVFSGNAVIFALLFDAIGLPYDLWLLRFLEIFSSIFNMQYDDMKHLTALCLVKASNVTSRYYTDTE